MLSFSRVYDGFSVDYLDIHILEAAEHKFLSRIVISIVTQYRELLR